MKTTQSEKTFTEGKSSTLVMRERRRRIQRFQCFTQMLTGSQREPHCIKALLRAYEELYWLLRLSVLTSGKKPSSRNPFYHLPGGWQEKRTKRALSDAII